jgi:YVTN family beta-propeller protein
MLAYFGARNRPAGRLMTRRAWLAAAGLSACGLRKVRGFSGYAFVANAGERTVSAVDLSTFTLAWRFGFEAPPSTVLAHPLRPGALVLLPDNGVLCAIDAAAMAAGRKIRLGPALNMRLSADGKSLWVLQPRALVRVDPVHLRPLQSIKLPATAADFDLSRDDRAAVIMPQAARLALLRLPDGTLEHAAAFSWEPSLVRFQSDGKQVLVGSRADRSLTIVDTATGRTVVRLPLPLQPAHFCFSSDGGQLFISGPGMDAVAIVYPYQTEVAETILAGRAPDGMATSANPSYLFVANPQTGTMTVLDIDTRKLVAAVYVGQEPRRILITPDNRYALVLNQRSGDMAVVRIAAFTERRHRNDPPPLFTMVPLGLQPVSGAIVAMG